MANHLSSGRTAARNPYSPSIVTALVGDSGPVHPGLVGHPLVSPTVQVQILSVIDFTGSASIGDIIAELPGHTDPVGAVFALIAAGVLEVRSTGFIDANTIVTRAGHCDPQDGADGPVPSPDAGPSDLPPTPLASDIDVLPANFAELSAEVLPHKLDAVPVSRLQPQIIVGSGERRAGFRRVDCLSRPGVYILLRGRDAYVGYGADVGARIMNGRQMPGGTPDCVIAIVDEWNGLSTDDAKAFERILWSWVGNDDDFDLVNGVPDGAAIDPDRYDQLTLLGAQVALALRQAGLMFLDGSVREHIAGPRTEPDRLGAPRRIDDLPDGRVMELNYCGLTALAADREDGTWLLLRGSDVRVDTVASANASASFQRAAWLHAGLLEPARDSSCYVLKRDIVFSSGSAVSHFVSGSKGFGLSAWQPIDEVDADLPEPAL